MLITCSSNEGFEDQLTSGTEYRALEFKRGSVLVLNNGGVERWYGMSKFTLARQ